MGRGQILCQTSYSHHLKNDQLEIKCHYKQSCLVKNLSKETLLRKTCSDSKYRFVFSFKKIPQKKKCKQWLHRVREGGVYTRERTDQLQLSGLGQLESNKKWPMVGYNFEACLAFSLCLLTAALLHAPGSQQHPLEVKWGGGNTFCCCDCLGLCCLPLRLDLFPRSLNKLLQERKAIVKCE